MSNQTGAPEPTSLERAVHATKDVKERAEKGRRDGTPGRVRVGEFWFGDAGYESVILFRQATKAQLTALEAFESRPPHERAVKNKEAFSACVLWFDGINDKSTAEDVSAYITSMEDLYPQIWSELIVEWDMHNKGARHDLRGKV